MAKRIDKNLIEKALNGDAQAFGDIYYTLRGAIYGFSYRMLGSRENADDVTQEVFLFFIEHSEKYIAERGELLSFLCGVARNRIYRRLKKDNTQFVYSQDDLSEFDEPQADGGKNPLTLLLADELEVRVDQEIANLPSFQKEVYILREIEELSYQEISQITETDINTVKGRIHRARRNLAKRLKPYFIANEEESYEVC